MQTEEKQEQGRADESRLTVKGPQQERRKDLETERHADGQKDQQDEQTEKPNRYYDRNDSPAQKR